MTELVDFSSADKITVVSLCVLIVVAFFRGWIVPGPTHRQIVDDKNQQIADLTAANTTLMEFGRTTNAALESVADLAEKRRGT